MSVRIIPAEKIKKDMCIKSDGALRLWSILHETIWHTPVNVVAVKTRSVPSKSIPTKYKYAGHSYLKTLSRAVRRQSSITKLYRQKNSQLLSKVNKRLRGKEETEKQEIRRHKYSISAAYNHLSFSCAELLQLQEQMKMHVQLAAQTCLLSDRKEFESINESAKNLLKELKLFSPRETTINKSSVFAAPNLNGAVKVVEMLEMQPHSTKLFDVLENSRNQSELEDLVKTTLYKSTKNGEDIFIYPNLMPKCNFENSITTDPQPFLVSEDNLIMLGAEKYQDFQSHKLTLIQFHSLPHRSKYEIQDRYRLLKEKALTCEVEKILDRRIHKKKIQYLLKWKGYSLAESTWVSRENLKCPGLLEAFERKWTQKIARQKRKNLKTETSKKKSQSKPKAKRKKKTNTVPYKEKTKRKKQIYKNRTSGELNPTYNCPMCEGMLLNSPDCKCDILASLHKIGNSSKLKESSTSTPKILEMSFEVDKSNDDEEFCFPPLNSNTIQEENSNSKTLLESEIQLDLLRPCVKLEVLDDDYTCSNVNEISFDIAEPIHKRQKLFSSFESFNDREPISSLSHRLDSGSLMQIEMRDMASDSLQISDLRPVNSRLLIKQENDIDELDVRMQENAKQPNTKSQKKIIALRRLLAKEIELLDLETYNKFVLTLNKYSTINTFSIELYSELKEVLQDFSSVLLDCLLLFFSHAKLNNVTEVINILNLK